MASNSKITWKKRDHRDAKIKKRRDTARRNKTAKAAKKQFFVRKHVLKNLGSRGCRKTHWPASDTSPAR